MKLFLITDTHFGQHQIAYEKWLKVGLQYLYNEFIPILQERYTEGDQIIHLGDLFDNRTSLHIRVMTEIIKAWSEISKIAPTKFILGNHDMYSQTHYEYASPYCLSGIPNIQILNTHHQEILHNKHITYLPYMTNPEKQEKLMNTLEGGDYLFCHTDLHGARLNHSDFTLDCYLRPENFKKWKKTYSGHIHIKQDVNKYFTYLGNPWEQDLNDAGNEKGMHILDLETNKLEFIPNKTSPKHTIIQVCNRETLEQAEQVKDSEWTILSISREYIVNNPKDAKILDNLIKNKKFKDIRRDNNIQKTPHIAPTITEKFDIHSLLHKKLNTYALEEKQKTRLTELVNIITNTLNQYK